MRERYQGMNIKREAVVKAFSRGVGLCLAAVMIIVSGVLSGSETQVYAQESPYRKVVRVGWYDSEFNKMDQYGRRTGYAYEYQQEIAAYTGWEYEYVEGGWSELLEMLANGEIDLMTDVSYTPERAEKMLYSAQPMGNEEYHIYVLAGNEEITPEDYSTLNGKRIGVSKGSIQKSIYEQWAKDNDVEAKLIEVKESEEEHAQRLRSGDLDAFIDFSAFNKYMPDSMPIVTIGTSDFYFAINKDRPDLKKDIDSAMNQILGQNRGYNKDLDDKYISNGGAQRYLSTTEIKWLENHGKVRIGYWDDYLPFSGTENGEATGLIKDYVELTQNAMKNASIEYELVPYPSTTSALDALQNNEIDMVFPVYFSDYDAEQRGVLITQSFGDNKIDAVIKKSNVSSFNIQEPHTVAIVSTSASQESVIMDNFPGWEIDRYQSVSDCIKAVANGHADCTLISDYRIGRFDEELARYRLTTVGTGTTIKEAFALRKDDVTLYAIVSKLNVTIADADVYAAMSKYSIEIKKVSVRDFVKDNMPFVMLLMTLTIVLVSFFLIRAVRTSKKIKKVNKELNVAKEAAEQASTAKSDFLFNMSHDIRTPMNAIVGFTDMALRHEEDADMMRESLKKISISSAQLVALINDILDMSRIESGKIELHKEIGSVAIACENVSSFFLTAAEQKKIKLEVKSENIQHDGINGDLKAINRILMNLISNAIKFTPENGSVTVSISEEPTADAKIANYKFIVSDTGIGMSPEFQEKIFEPFERERTSTVSKTQGTGLGMAIVKHLVDAMDGTIEIKSQKDEGTTFIVKLPLELSAESTADPVNTIHEKRDAEQAQHQDKAFDSDDVSYLHGKHVLLVEDIEINREIASMILQDQQMIVHEAENGREAIYLFNSDPDLYDLILMDIQMPVMNGYEATKAIRELRNDKAQTIPIIAMTANAFAEDKLSAIEAGMNDHVAKPIDIEQLYRTMIKYLRA